RREAVEVERIGDQHQLGQPRGDIAQRQQQLHAAFLEAKTVQVGRQRRPGVDQRGGEGGQRRVGVRGGEVVPTQRVLLDRNEYQPLAARRVLAPGVPGGQEVVAE